MSDCKVLKCCNCGVNFALNNDIYQRRLSDKQDFYCPNGHAQHFVGTSAADLVVELKEKINNLERNLSYWRKEAERLLESCRHLRLTIGAYKGVITKLKKAK